MSSDETKGGGFYEGSCEKNEGLQVVLQKKVGDNGFVPTARRKP